MGTVTGTVPACGQTAASYPRQLAAVFNLNLTDMTCSGATTANVISTAQGSNPIQVSALSASTDIVTLTIGGNDLGFTSVLGGCAAWGANGPLITNPLPAPLPSPTNCKSVLAPDGEVDSLAALIAVAVAPSLAATLTTIKSQAPNAKIFVVGYPALMPDVANTPVTPAPAPDTGCFSFGPVAFPFTITDVKYLHGIQAQLDTAMSAATVAAGATFVPMFTSTLGNTPCANNTLTFINGGLDPNAPMHPNMDGANAMSASTKAAIEATLAAPTISPASASIAVPVDVAASLSFVATGFPTPTWSIEGDLPADVAFDTATGVLSGTPRDTGVLTFSVKATNTVGVATETFTVTVIETPVITSAAPPSPGTVDTPYSFPVTASGFPAPAMTLKGALPTGLTFTPGVGTATISGTPTTAGTFNFTVTATNAAGTVTSETYTIAVNPAAVAPTITSPAPPAAKLGSAYSFNVVATGYPAPTFAVTSGELPKGLSLAPSGAISGTPTVAGKFAFSITASNGTDPASTVQYAIEVTGPTVVTPDTPNTPALVTTGSASFLALGFAGGILLLSGAGLLATRKMVKG